MKHFTLQIWLLDYNEETGEIEFHLCNRSEWNGVTVTAQRAAEMQEEFTRTGTTSWIGSESRIDFVKGPGPVDQFADRFRNDDISVSLRGFGLDAAEQRLRQHNVDDGRVDEDPFHALMDAMYAEHGADFEALAFVQWAQGSEKVRQMFMAAARIVAGKAYWKACPTCSGEAMMSSPNDPECSSCGHVGLVRRDTEGERS